MFPFLARSSSFTNCTSPSTSQGVWRERCWERKRSTNGDPTSCVQYLWNYENGENFDYQHSLKCGNDETMIHYHSVYNGSLSTTNCTFYQHILTIQGITWNGNHSWSLSQCYQETIQFPPIPFPVSSYRGVNDDDDDNPSDYSEIAQVTLGSAARLSVRNVVFFLLFILFAASNFF